MSVKSQLKSKIEERNAKADDLASIFAEAGPELDMNKIKSLEGDSAAKAAEIRTRNEELGALKNEIDTLKAVEAAALASVEREDTEAGDEPGTKAIKERAFKPMGEAFVESKAFKGYEPGAGVGPVAHVDVDLKTLFATSAGWAPESLRTGIVSMYPTRPAPVVVDYLPQIPTKMAAVKYMEETTFTNSAAETAEGSAYPESALALTERSKTVYKIPTFLPVTDEQLEDVDEAEAYVNSRLVFFLQQRLDLQVLTGDGNAPNILGTESVSGIQTQALGTDPIPDAIYKVARKIRDDGFADPGVVFIRAAKWETVRLMRTADGVYIWGHPSASGPEQIWGLPVVQTNAPTATKAIIGDYQHHSALYVRRGVDIQVSNSHSTYFVEGKLAIRADVRVAMVHYRPKAFGTVTGL